MDDRQFEQALARLLREDHSAGTETFRDELLVRCLAVLDADCRADELDDADLEMLAAAGDGMCAWEPPMPEGSR